MRPLALFSIIPLLTSIRALPATKQHQPSNASPVAYGAGKPDLGSQGGWGHLPSTVSHRKRGGACKRPNDKHALSSDTGAHIHSEPLTQAAPDSSPTTERSAAPTSSSTAPTQNDPQNIEVESTASVITSPAPTEMATHVSSAVPSSTTTGAQPTEQPVSSLVSEDVPQPSASSSPEVTEGPASSDTVPPAPLPSTREDESASAPPVETTPLGPLPSSQPNPSPANQGNGSPVGLAVNGRLAVDVGSFSSGLGWYYDWDVKPLPGYESLEFVPMLHGRKWVDEFSPDQLKGHRYALSFNEPNIAATPEDGGSGMGFAEAAELHKKWTAMAPSDVQIGSISPSRGGGGYFKQWYDACGGDACRMDFIAFHFYGMNIDQLQAEVEVYKTYNKPIWVTEVACREYREDSPGTWVLHHCTDQERDTLMSEMIRYFNDEPQIERWAWFGAVSELVESNDENSIVDAAGKANNLGQLYAGNRH